jgi:O-antigen ligase
MKQAFRVSAQHPIFGVGFGHYADEQIKIQRDPGGVAARVFRVLTQHNLFLSMLAETGVIGLVGTVALFLILLRQSLIMYRRIPPSASGLLCRDFVILFWVAMANYLTNAMFVDPFWDPASNALFWCFAGMTIGYGRLLEPHPTDLLVEPVPAGA